MVRAFIRTLIVASMISGAVPAAAADKDDATSHYLPSPPVIYPDGVTSRRDVTYAELSGFRPLTLDLYLPKAGGPLRPLVVFVHGGAWLHLTARDGGTFHDFPAVLASMAARGYVVASVNYRDSGEAPFPGPVRDVAMAIQWLRKHSAENGIDPGRVVLWGSSAGGNMATLIGTGCHASNLVPPSDGPSACVQGVIDWYGLVDVGRDTEDLGPSVSAKVTSYLNRYLGCEMTKCPAGWVASTDPITYIDGKAPPFLIQHGLADTTVSVKQSQRLYAALRAAGVPAEIVTYPGVRHGFAALAGGPDDAVNAQALAKVYEFLAQRFPPDAK